MKIYFNNFCDELANNNWKAFNSLNEMRELRVDFATNNDYEGWDALELDRIASLIVANTSKDYFEGTEKPYTQALEMLKNLAK